MNTLILFMLALLTVLVVGLIVAFLALSRQVGVLFERITPVGAMINDNGPAIGDPSPVFTLPSLNHGPVTLGGVQAKSTLVFFLSPTCPICKTLLPVVKNLHTAERAWLNIVLASDGDSEKQRAFIRQQQLDDIPYVLSQELGMTWRVAKLPFSVLLNPQGVITSKGLINSREQFESLFNAQESGVESIQAYSRASSLTANP
ncbi:thiol-disulfide isomerase [Chimaeribacter arupi]|nr:MULTISPECIES: thioredoxin-like domain-containing protein [Yersiniaceae]MDV5139712.1 redoxin domain-containing protein [Chimaeribacter arupi]PLR29514.1 thiol-disulfide isomerase [Chimaeribacter arupi]PLR46695.1 thiol-disulfide isomerase [Chimaeribacter arupi]PLR52879.1 thiol-disulfide isomerase [Chimaeribacter arupi]WKZ94638.1 redoxin domain-containing protein [Chimaeribacter arupi]